MSSTHQLLLIAATAVAVVRLIRPGTVIDRAIGLELLLGAGLAWLLLNLSDVASPVMTLILLVVPLMFVAGAVIAASVHDLHREEP